jgi:Protein of unknown function (DUF2419).
MLHQLNCLRYAPKLENHIRDLKPIEPGSNWEIELRGTSIWCVELIKREIEKQHPEVKMNRQPHLSKSISDGSENFETDNSDESGNKLKIVEKPRKTYGINAILIDFFLYDTMKNLEAEKNESIPHHRTRSIWY